MAFCQNCGEKLEEGAKFCASCGTAVGNTGSENVRKQTFVGDVRKCPSCGAEVPSMTAVCPECGHEFSNKSVSSVQKEFQNGLIKFKGEELLNYIASFPIPNTREDLGNFLTLISSILISDLEKGAEALRITAFISKFKEVKSKIELMLPEDDKIRIKSDELEKEITEKSQKNDERIKKDKRSKQTKETTKATFSFIGKIINSFLKHPIKNSIIVVIVICIGACSFGLDEFWNGTPTPKEVTNFEAKKIKIPADKVKLPSIIKEKFTVVSDATVSATNGMESFYLEFDILCNSPLTSIKESKIDAFKKKNKSSIKELQEDSESFSMSITGLSENNSFSSYNSEINKLAKKLFFMKKDTKETISLYIKPSFDSDKKKLLEFLKLVETTNSISINDYAYSIKLTYKNFSDEYKYETIHLKD